MVEKKEWEDFWNDEEKIPVATTPETPALKEADMINHPPHYTAGNIECIDAIEVAMQDLDGWEGYCIGNAIKYLWRWKYKGGKQDIAKAQWYLNRLMDTLNKRESSHV